MHEPNPCSHIFSITIYSRYLRKVDSPLTEYREKTGTPISVFLRTCFKERIGLLIGFFDERKRHFKTSK